MPTAFAHASVPQSGPSLRLRFPLIEPDVQVSRIRLSDGRRSVAHVVACCIWGRDSPNRHDFATEPSLFRGHLTLKSG